MTRDFSSFGTQARRMKQPDRHTLNDAFHRLKVEDEDEDKVPDFGGEEIPEDDTDFIRILTRREWEDLQATRLASATPAPEEDFIAVGPNDTPLEPGTCVELNDGDFLYIVYVGRRGANKLTGILLRRSRRVQDMLPKKLSEVCAVLQTRFTRNTAPDPRIDECLVTRSFDEVVKLRDIIFTNQLFPALSWRDSVDVGKYYYFGDDGKLHCDAEDVEDNATLICRWKEVEVCNVNSGKVFIHTLLTLREEECTPGKGISDVLLKNTWVGDPQPSRAKGKTRETETPELMEVAKEDFESHKRAKRNKVDFDFTKDEDESDVEVLETTVTQKYKWKTQAGSYEKRQTSTTTERIARSSTRSESRVPASTSATAYRYTLGDLCTGGGGMAQGAVEAGLLPKFFLDKEPDPCHTLRLNFGPHVEILETEIFDFCIGDVDVRVEYRVGILHISFPCQPHSSAHTVEGRNDDANIATGYSVVPILEKCRPRVVTFEQTSGIKSHNGGWHFRALIHQLSVAGYSSRSMTADLADFGNVQARKRLIIVAAAPGEILPPFPDPTHGDGPGLKPFVTIRDCLSKIDYSKVEPHMLVFTPKHEPPYDAGQPLRHCITTNGGEGNLHPSGKRTFNLVELACLAGFPPTHRFYGNTGSIKRQIGNAVPACFARTLFKEIIKTLRKSDRIDAEYKPEVIDLEED